VGYLPIERQGASLFFQLISRRYERGPMNLTSNQSFGSWADVFWRSPPRRSSTA
jgi:DNA replication protein DnaC